MSFDQLYQEQILDHYKNPRNFGELRGATVKFKDFNPSCGDEVEMQFVISDKTISEVKFHGRGCAISQAAASLLTDKIKGQPIKSVKKIGNDEMFELLGVKLSPMRVKCGLLALKATEKALQKYLPR
ncbi:MAG: SUF system NifU family Fe-S cluster assembly protein [Candidatus Buchananbacteria bacterium CG10_big_fil_rev_8_21_14_0_10_42_9]|uniref:SUF system NifU family Fe-S cluster assembly protein n=1 Tax=Candidatus Buchananbacteria bacterium CG10_big_fil_rev_8_21_14_0_10_42_9 TaxID=1974526 RepID=A0A2H0W035_9BACT|nr:MAG: SUF system NifU family Fe-S cluster assembly protein [Candidatus Buchananbacteria bacterium CG10_big_fil_rev_8_21_14_0_10_42_9]